MRKRFSVSLQPWLAVILRLQTYFFYNSYPLQSQYLRSILIKKTLGKNPILNNKLRVFTSGDVHQRTERKRHVARTTARRVSLSHGVVGLLHVHGEDQDHGSNCVSVTASCYYVPGTLSRFKLRPHNRAYLYSLLSEYVCTYVPNLGIR